MTISPKNRLAFLALIVSVISLSPCSIVFAADAMPTFTKDDFADCKITGFEYDYSMQSQDENHSGIYVSYNGDHLQFWLDFYKNADEAKTNFQIYRDSHIKDVDLLKELPCITVLEADFTDTESTLIYYGETSSCTGEKYYVVKFAMLYADNYFSRGEFGARAADFSEQQVRDALAQMKDCIIKVINSKDRKFWGKVTNAWGKPLQNMVVKLSYDNKEYETTTDSNGDYKIPFQGQFGKESKISFLMQYRMAGTDYFMIVLHDLNQPYAFVKEFTLRDAKDLKQDFVVQGEQKGLEFLGYLYYRLHEAVNFYTTVLKIKPESIRAAPFIPNISYSQYLIPEKLIGIGLFATVFMKYNDTLPVRSTEYHEYSHHVMNSVYGKIPRSQTTTPVEEINHSGYTNPSTTDSFVEGFAVFMSQVIKDKLGLPNGGVDDKVGKIEQNFLAWGSEGFDELYSAAGIFWDLYDGIEPKDNDAVQLTIEQIWDVLKIERQNMNELYQALVKAYPEQKAGIDQIFISHGFFADTDKGNESYDPGEPARKTDDGTVSYFVDLANPVVWDNKKVAGKDSGEKETIGKAANYQRLERNFPPTLPGHFIKTDGSFPFYKISCTFPGYPALDYELIVEQLDGLIPIAVPPEQYQATITIEGYGSEVTTDSPLGFTNQEFLSSYSDIIKKGYFREHDFQITGPALERPEVDPSLINAEKSSCFASSVLGADDPRLNTLRRFRDEVLVKSSIGKQLVKIYYEKSRTVIEALEGHEFYRKIAAALLNKIIPVLEMTLT